VIVNPIYYATVTVILPEVDNRVLHERKFSAVCPSECGKQGFNDTFFNAC